MSLCGARDFYENPLWKDKETIVPHIKIFPLTELLYYIIIESVLYGHYMSYVY